jgi:hypothetical protein
MRYGVLFLIVHVPGGTAARTAQLTVTATVLTRQPEFAPALGAWRRADNVVAGTIYAAAFAVWAFGPSLAMAGRTVVVVVAHQSSTYAKSVLKHHTPASLCMVNSLPFTDIAIGARVR